MGVFGGTFDPVHCGHLHVAEAVRQQLSMDPVIFVPTSQPLLRDKPAADPDHRLAMVRLAIEGWHGFEADDREIRRAGPSYTVLTLEELRNELPTVPLCLILGLDTFLQLPQWHRWTELLDFAHIAVMRRPGWSAPAHLPEWWTQAITNTVDDLARWTAGLIIFVNVPLTDISSTRVRERLYQGTLSSDLLPPAVTNYIKDHALYGYEH